MANNCRQSERRRTGKRAGNGQRWARVRERKRALLVAKTKFAKWGRISRVLSSHLSKRHGERELKKEELAGQSRENELPWLRFRPNFLDVRVMLNENHVPSTIRDPILISMPNHYRTLCIPVRVYCASNKIDGRALLLKIINICSEETIHRLTVFYDASPAKILSALTSGIAVPVVSDITIINRPLEWRSLIVECRRESPHVVHESVGTLYSSRARQSHDLS